MPKSLEQRESAVERLFRLLHRRRHQLSEMPQDLASQILQGLEGIQASDLRLRAQDPSRLRGRGGVGYQDVYSGPDMTLCIFLIRAGSYIPMHDHPGMHVFGRLLFGRMQVVAYDLEQESPGSPPDLGDLEPDSPELGHSHGHEVRRRLRRARLTQDNVLGPEPVTYSLGPSRYNIHELHALEDLAFFDIVSPPYNTRVGRDCTYYARVAAGTSPEARSPPEGSCWLEVVKPPRTFSTEPMAYNGPSFHDFAAEKDLGL